MKKRLRGVFLNTEESTCGIYELGKICYSCLTKSDNYSLDYVELSSKNREISLNYDFYIFNYHWVKMGWLDTKLIKQLPGFKATIVLEMSQDSPFDYVSKDDFDAYLVLDPTCKYFQDNVYVFPRPLEATINQVVAYKAGKVPVIGTFGLSFSNEGFDEVVKAVNEEFEAATIRINVPNSAKINSVDLSNFKKLLADISLKGNIKVELSDRCFNKNELINWCAQNTLNVFLYNGHVGNELSTAPDLAIASGRPIAISTNPAFRHIHAYIKPYPYLSLKESIKSTIPLVKKIQEDWSPPNFVSKFETVLKENRFKSLKITNTPEIKLPVIKNSFSSFMDRLFTKQGLVDFIPPILFKARDQLRIVFNWNNKPTQETPVQVLRPFVHQILQSNSQFQEDLLIDLLLSRKKNGVYVDIGASDPFFNSNTRRFYLKGWRGINIEPGISEFNKIAENRKFDINLNMGVSEKSGKLPIYLLGNDSSLSTLDYKMAVKMAGMYKLKLTSSKVDVMPISKILDAYLGNKHIDFMSIDTEGYDLVVLRSNNWDKYRPTLVLVESYIDSREIIMFMEKHNYLYIFSNHANALFVDKMTADKNILDNISWNSLRM